MLLDPGGLHGPVDIIGGYAVHSELLKLPAAVRLVYADFFIVSDELREGDPQQL